MGRRLTKKQLAAMFAKKSNFSPLYEHFKNVRKYKKNDRLYIPLSVPQRTAGQMAYITKVSKAIDGTLIYEIKTDEGESWAYGEEELETYRKEDADIEK